MSGSCPANSRCSPLRPNAASGRPTVLASSRTWPNAKHKLKALAEHMLQVEEMERRRISRELHDDAGQSLVCIRLQLELTEGEVPEELLNVRSNLKEIRDLTEKTILDIRRLISDLSPAVLEQLGLGAAVRQLVNRFQKAYPCTVRLHVGKLTDVPHKVQIVTYRLLQECCNNIARHSRPLIVNISVTSADRVLKLNVSDDGVGFLDGRRSRQAQIVRIGWNARACGAAGWAIPDP